MLSRKNEESRTECKSQTNYTCNLSYSLSGQQRQKPILPLALLRATRLHFKSVLPLLGSSEAMIVAQSEALPEEPRTNTVVLLNNAINKNEVCLNMD